ncbi:hypothetical protein [Thalassomonas haliotis]|uniref:Uncharacterized protein n=1 Tax=Thalassomonas haliotis TaxID=485448 RepID=A0ABY7VKD5_9GAMM|nr:hypothetical protein [Thalassomonas haliotis]WDE14207.1 hypothetical protein H3N35_12790 [Thalassomonas haliotis]
MKNNKGLFFASAVTASVLLLIYFQPFTGNMHRNQDSAEQQNLGGDNKTSLPTALKPLPSPPSRATVKPLKPQLLSLAEDVAPEDEAETSAWRLNEQPLDTVPTSFAGTPYQTVSFNSSLQAQISVGDTVSLPLPDGSTVEVRVTKEGLESNGDYTFEGNIEQNNHSFPVVITQGANGTFGSIATSDNTYSITTLDGVGVIYQNPPLPPSHDDDFLVVPKLAQ